MKKTARKCIAAVLGWQVRRLRRRNEFTVVGVVGSIGKTSTKFALATVLGQSKKVRFQSGNYNDLVTVPLIFFGYGLPSLFNPLAWLALLLKIERQLRRPYKYDVVIVELGTDGPGQIAEFGAYLDLDIAVVTAITPEHMEYFKTLQAVADEEFSVRNFARRLVINSDLCEQQYVPDDALVTSYGERTADYQLVEPKFSMATATFGVKHDSKVWLRAQMEAVAKSELYSATAAATVADILAMDMASIKEGIAKIKPVSGRMQRLEGIKQSLLLDESYNASPKAVMAALDSLYQMQAPQKIALLGNMNELGDLTEQSHRDIGEYCEPEQLDLVITLGPEANSYLAPAAKARGCQVVTCETPYEAGEIIAKHLKPKAVVLIKGSQNNVYAEEAIKPLLANPSDAKLLVRQSRDWMHKKAKNFGKVAS